MPSKRATGPLDANDKKRNSVKDADLVADLVIKASLIVFGFDNIRP